MAKESKRSDDAARDLSREEVAEYMRYRAVGKPAPDKFNDVVVENTNGNFIVRRMTDEERAAHDDAHAETLKAAKANEDAMRALVDEVGPIPFASGPGYVGGNAGSGTA